jgi:hypothetical protein
MSSPSSEPPSFAKRPRLEENEFLTKGFIALPLSELMTMFECKDKVSAQHGPVTEAVSELFEIISEKLSKAVRRHLDLNNQNTDVDSKEVIKKYKERIEQFKISTDGSNYRSGYLLQFDSATYYHENEKDLFSLSLQEQIALEKEGMTWSASTPGYGPFTPATPQALLAHTADTLELIKARLWELADYFEPQKY